MNHKQTETRATAYLFGELLPEEAIAFELELEYSPELRRDVDALRDAIGALRSRIQSTAEDVNPTHRRAINRAIEEASESREIGPVDTPVPPPVVLGPDATRSRQWLLPAAIAATLLMGFGLTFPSLLGTGGNSLVSQIPMASQHT
jgi:anti-sigma factor RsiW